MLGACVGGLTLTGYSLVDLGLVGVCESPGVNIRCPRNKSESTGTDRQERDLTSDTRCNIQCVFRTNLILGVVHLIMKPSYNINL